MKTVDSHSPRRAYYAAPAPDFCTADPLAILGALSAGMTADLNTAQRGAWEAEIPIMRAALADFPEAHIAFEYVIPRIGRRVDVVVILANLLFVIEFKVGARSFDRSAIDQVVDYTLDLKNFHDASHDITIVPILVATQAASQSIAITLSADGVAQPLRSDPQNLAAVMRACLLHGIGPDITPTAWLQAGFRPTPTIIEASQALYRGHAVRDISRSEAGSDNLGATTRALVEIIHRARTTRRKALCLLTGVPGAGKTLAGLNLACETRRSEFDETEHAVFLSGNGALVKVLREALARDEVEQVAGKGGNLSKQEAVRHASRFIQNIHHFRGDCLTSTEAPRERVVVFDEAQRAWNREQTAKFMRERGEPDFPLSEPAFLIGAMDRHVEWAVIVCLIGDGQEINTGEAGVGEWISAIHDHYPHWQIHVPEILHSQMLNLSPSCSDWLARSANRHADLHLRVSLRSFRSEQLSDAVAALLEREADAVRERLSSILNRYPIVITRSLDTARNWVRRQARGTERYGLLASSGGKRLKPLGVYVMTNSIDPCNWFLNGRNDVRSSYFLEDPASEFEVQGLELDWTIVCWDGDLIRDGATWQYRRFSGSKWQNINKDVDRLYRLNAYRVLLTRARQGMVIFVPDGTSTDPTRPPAIYDPTWDYLRALGLPTL